MALNITRRAAPTLSLVLALTMAQEAVAQQFTVQNGVLPGPARWSEGVTAVDVDLDGDKDLLFADGDGFASASTQRQNLLFINQTTPGGALSFTDESVLRLGVNLSNCKQAIAGDVNGDSYPDLLFVNAFNTDTPSLYINRGALQPGFFDLESATRGLTEPLSSAGAQFGDLDDDGDLDLVISDSGASFLGGAGERPRMYFNDGAGNFTDVSTQLNAPIMVAQMDVHLVDIDSDFDLDIVITNRGARHYLLLNDGTGVFSDSSALLPLTGLVYEAEVADFDGDSDVDFFFLSQTGFNEGYVENRLVPTGALSFVKGPTVPGGTDDNEIGLIDYDMDGDLDVLVGSLGNRERLYRNDGGLSFTLVNGIVQSVGDSTLDLCVADLDGDGDYDFVTAQGESGNFTNRVYVNSGPADTIAPRFTAMDTPIEQAGDFVIHAKCTDQLMDDSEAFLRVDWFVTRVRAEVFEISVTPAGFVPATATLTRGTRVRFVDGGVGATNIEGTAPATWSRLLPAGGSVDRAFVATTDHTISASGVAGSLQITTTNTLSAVTQGFTPHMGNGLFRGFIDASFVGTGPTAELGLVFRATDDAGNVGWSDSLILRDQSAPGQNYCDANSNSTGMPGSIIARGTDLLSAQSLTLEAWSLPPNTFGIFVAARQQGAVPLSQGILCLTPPFVRFSQMIQNSGPLGMTSMSVPFTNLPPGANFAVGDTWNFTYWFRDVAPIGSANLTDGVEINWR